MTVIAVTVCTVSFTAIQEVFIGGQTFTALPLVVATVASPQEMFVATYQYPDLTLADVLSCSPKWFSC